MIRLFQASSPGWRQAVECVEEVELSSGGARQCEHGCHHRTASPNAAFDERSGDLMPLEVADRIRDRLDSFRTCHRAGSDVIPDLNIVDGERMVSAGSDDPSASADAPCRGCECPVEVSDHDETLSVRSRMPRAAEPPSQNAEWGGPKTSPL
jgi:hypothetical protein